MNFKRLLAAGPKPPVTAPLKTLYTPWGEAIRDGAVAPEAVRAAHPHPQCARERFAMLNGWWSCRFLSVDDEWPATWDDATPILVPFSPEAPLSGVGRQLKPDELLAYRRTFDCPPLARPDDRLLLHFEAVDYACDVYVNGYPVGSHEGAYLPFAFDITAYAQAAANELVVVVADPSDRGVQLRGKQRLERGGIWYTAQSGIWQPVWLEVVPKMAVESVQLTPDVTTGTLQVDVMATGTAPLVVEVYPGRCAQDEDGDWLVPQGVPLVRAETARGRSLKLALPPEAVALWTPDAPTLYPVTIRFGDDVIHSYTAFRTVDVAPDEHGNGRVRLNGAPVFLRGVLDQGYWSDGLMTAPSDAAFVFDIVSMRDAGFNLLRKHIKVEADRYYYHCDRLGMLVMQDMVCGGGVYQDLSTSYLPTFFRWAWGHYPDDVPRGFVPLGAGAQAYREEWLAAAAETVEYLRAHPSIVAWCVFNEGWGQFRAVEAAELVSRLDPTRPIDATSGWYDQRCGDFRSVHNYFRKLEVYPDYFGSARRHRAFFISEFGGLTWYVSGHSVLDTAYGYANFDSLPDWQLAVAAELATCDDLKSSGLAGFVYTQLSDVEEETNGLLTYDRRINKLTP